MKWWQRISSLFSRRVARGKADIYYIFLRCSNCGQKLKICVHPEADLIRGYSDEEPAYVLRKEALDGRCFHLIGVCINYDENLNELSRQIEGGEFITEGEFLSDE